MDHVEGLDGLTRGALAGANAGHGDAFIAKYTRAGSRLWTRQLGTTGNEEANGVSANGGAVYIAGWCRTYSASTIAGIAIARARASP